MRNRKTPEERVTDAPTHVCRVTASVLVPGVAGIMLAPGKLVRLDAQVAPSLTLGDLVNPEWFQAIEDAQIVNNAPAAAEGNDGNGSE